MEKDCLCLHCPDYLISTSSSQSSHQMVVLLIDNSSELDSAEVYEAERKGRGRGTEVGAEG